MIREITTYDFLTILIVSGLVLIAISKVLFERRFNHFVSVFVNSSYLKVYEKDQKFLDLFDGILFLNLISSLAIFFWISYNSLVEELPFSITLILRMMLGIGVFILIKVLLERLVASIFDIDRVIDTYLFQKITYKNFLGLVILPLNAIFVYAYQPNKVVIFIVICLIFIINLVGLVTSYRYHQSSIKNAMFYFILYLCTLEIAPYLILYKVFIETTKA